MPDRLRLLRVVPWALAVLGAPGLHAQTGGAPSPEARRAAGTVSAFSVVRSVEGGAPFDGDSVRISQWSLPVSVAVDVTPSVALSLRTGYVSSSGRGVEALSGPSDTQLGASVSRGLGRGQVVVGVQANVPGGSAPTPDEARSVFLVSQRFYGLRPPSVGRGLALAPSVAWAVPLADGLAVGGALSYQVRGAFEPRTDGVARYDPGNELLATAGLDVRLGPTSAVAVDVAYVRYGQDTWGDLAFASGDAVGATAQWQGTAGPHEVRLLGAVRRRGERDVPPETEARLGLDAVPPGEGRVETHVGLRLSRRLGLGVTARGRYYAASAAFSDKGLVDLELRPTLALGDRVTGALRLGATVGSLRGTEAGVGVVWSL